MGHEVGVTAIQLAMAYCAIANGGFLLRPKLIRQVINSENYLFMLKNRQLLEKLQMKNYARSKKNA